MRVSHIFKEFLESEKAGGLILVFVTAVSLALANSPYYSTYSAIWNFEFAGHTTVHWINDGLMTIFFLLIGLELEREIYVGELSNVKKAILPILGAFGGMLVPVGIYMFINRNTGSFTGAGIPMATDIAFAIGILSLLGNRVPLSLKIFLTALAVIDDLGAILVISIFYTSDIVYTNLFIALAIFGFLLLLNRLKVYNLIPYMLGGIGMWYFMLHSGVHATITGVLLAFAVPFGNGRENSPSHKLQHFLHRPVAFLILPLFALANTCINIDPSWQNGVMEANSLGITGGLLLGKPIGIFLFAFLGVKFGLATLPTGLKWKDIAGTGFLGGIGFTMSIFITMLAFGSTDMSVSSKIAILGASFMAGLIGFTWLSITLEEK